MIEVECSCCGEHTELLHDPDHALHERLTGRCGECGGVGEVIAHESDDGWSVERFELVVPRSEVERLAAEDRRDRRNHRELVQIHAVWMFATDEWDDLWGKRQIALKAFPRIREDWLAAEWHQRLGNRALARCYRQSARDRGRHLRRVFASAPELEREALEHVLAAARRP